MAQLLSSTANGGGGRGGQLRLKMYLSLLWAASAEPYRVVRPARAWAALLGLPDPPGKGARRVQSTLRELADRNLVTLESRGGMPNVVTLLSDLGTGEPYEPPSATYNRLRTSAAPSDQLVQHQYFRVPSSVWTSGLMARLSGPGLAMLLILRSEQRSEDGLPVWFSPSRAAARFGLSETTRRAGLEELRREALVTSVSQKLTESGGSLDVYRRRKVHTLDFTRISFRPRPLIDLQMNIVGDDGAETPDERVSVQEQILDLRGHTLGPDHPDTLTTRSNLASAYASVGRLDDATLLFESTIADRERILGPDHPLPWPHAAISPASTAP